MLRRLAVYRCQDSAAADADNDGMVTLDELAKVKLAAIPTSGTADLRAFVTALSRK